MVYFGSKRFKGTIKGMSSSDKKLVIRPLIIVVGRLAVYAMIYTQGSSDGPPPEDLPVDVVTESRPVSPRDAPITGSDATTGGLDPEVREIIDVAEVPDPNREPEPFQANPLLLFAVTDEGEANKLNDIGRGYLFHRWRAGVEVPIEESEFPAPGDLREMAPEIRGKRYSLVVTSRIEPFTRDLEDNPSGVVKYWEGWAHSPTLLFRILFLEKPEKLMNRGSDWQLEADFLRVHRYRDKSGALRAVPEMIARTLTPFDGKLDFGITSWTPLWITNGVAFVAVLVGLWWGNRWQQFERPKAMSQAMARRRAGRRRGASGSSEDPAR